MLRFLFALLLLGCQSASDLPLPEDRLVRIVADMQVAEAALVGLSGHVRDSTAAVYYDEIYALPDTNKETVVAGIDALKLQPERLEAFYGRVLRELERQGAHPGDPVD